MRSGKTTSTLCCLTEANDAVEVGSVGELIHATPWNELAESLLVWSTVRIVGVALSSIVGAKELLSSFVRSVVLIDKRNEVRESVITKGVKTHTPARER